MQNYKVGHRSNLYARACTAWNAAGDNTAVCCSSQVSQLPEVLHGGLQCVAVVKSVSYLRCCTEACSVLQ